MKKNHPGPADTASDACNLPAPATEPPPRIGIIDGHLPDLVDPLDPRDPDTALAQTRRLRHDGWNPEKKRRFLERFAECGVVREACEAAGMSARSAYNLRDREPLFAAGWDAAQMMARPRLADEAYSRALNGVVERIYRDGLVVAERHRYDNRLTMSVLARLDARIDRAEEKGAPPLALIAHWDDYLEALEQDRREDALALLAAPAGEMHEKAGECELHAGQDDSYKDWEVGLDDDEEEPADPHEVWDHEGKWWTNYPPPPGFDGEEDGVYANYDYRRALSDAERAVAEADQAAKEADALAAGEALRDAYFGFIPPAVKGAARRRA